MEDGGGGPGRGRHELRAPRPDSPLPKGTRREGERGEMERKTEREADRSDGKRATGEKIDRERERARERRTDFRLGSVRATRRKKGKEKSEKTLEMTIKKRRGPCRAEAAAEQSDGPDWAGHAWPQGERAKKRKKERKKEKKE